MNGEREQLTQLMTDAAADNGRRGVGIAEWRERGVVPLSELYKHPDLLRPMPWDFRPFTAAGHISLLSAAPKVGKSTFMGLYAHAKATGSEFLGQVLSRGKVLIVSPDESWTTIGRRHKQLGSPPDQVYLWFDLEPTIERIAAKAAQLGADLILVDTLSRIAPVFKENDNAAWTRWFTENDHHFRDSSSAWLFSHHDRKSGGSGGMGIRGASAILGCVDIAFSLQRLDHRQDQQVLRMEGTRFDQVDDLIIQIDGGAYRVIGDRQTAAVLDNDEIMRVEEVLTDQPATVTEIGQALESTFRDQPRIPPSTLRRHLDDKLVAVGRAVPHGKGGHRDPYRYSKAGEPGQVVHSLEQSSGIPDNHTQPYTPNTDTLSKVAGEDLSTTPSPRVRTSGKSASNRIAEQEQQLSASHEETAGGAK